MLVAYTSGAARGRTPNRYGEDFLAHPDYLRTVDALLGEGGTETVHSAEYGEVWVTVLPVRNSHQGDLVIVNFLDDEHAELNRTLQTYGIVAPLSLGIITVVAGFQSGRLLSPLHTLQDTTNDINATDLSRRIPVTAERRHDGAVP